MIVSGDLPSTCAVYTTRFISHLSRISRKFHFEVVWLTGLNMQTLRHTSLQSCKKKSWHAQFKRSHVLHDQPWMATAPLGVCLVAQLRCLDFCRLACESSEAYGEKKYLTYIFFIILAIAHSTTQLLHHWKCIKV